MVRLLFVALILALFLLHPNRILFLDFCFDLLFCHLSLNQLCALLQNNNGTLNNDDDDDDDTDDDGEKKKSITKQNKKGKGKMR